MVDDKQLTDQASRSWQFPGSVDRTAVNRPGIANQSRSVHNSCVINSADTQASLQAAFPFLSQADTPLASLFMQTAAMVHLEKGQYVCREGGECMHLALLTRGTARVFKLGESGREITLYRVGLGQSCILTASCILSEQPFPAFAVCETDVEAAVVPAADVNRWLVEFPRWRSYIFGLMANRLSNIINVVEEVAFKRMDCRIADYLLRQQHQTSSKIRVTHQQIASDLGTSREVVSRILKDFENADFISVSRGVIELLDEEGIAAKAAKR